jgi:hypothetical protein
MCPSYVLYNSIHHVDPSGYFLKRLFQKIEEVVKAWFKPFADPEPTNPSWWVEAAGRAIPIFFPREASQQVQQGLQSGIPGTGYSNALDTLDALL